MTIRAPIRVRPASPADLELLVSFNRAMARETESKELDEALLRAGVRAVFEEPARGAYWVAEAGAEPVGALLVTTEWSDWRNGDFWWIQSAYVVPEQRGTGTFRALYDAVRRRAEEAPDVCGLRLYVERENERARAVYRAVGMAESRYRLYELDFVLGDEPPARPRA